MIAFEAHLPIGQAFVDAVRARRVYHSHIKTLTSKVSIAASLRDHIMIGFLTNSEVSH